MTTDNPDSGARDLRSGLDRFLLPPGMEVQVYRRREDDPKRFQYLGVYLDDWDVQLEDLKSFAAGELDGVAPLEWTRDVWGGGDYQFRFRWRDEWGRKTNVRSRDVSIAGRLVPRSRPAIAREAPDLPVRFGQGGEEGIRASAEWEEAMTLFLQVMAELRAEVRNHAPHSRQASPIEVAAAMVAAMNSVIAPTMAITNSTSGTNTGKKRPTR